MTTAFHHNLNEIYSDQTGLYLLVQKDSEYELYWNSGCGNDWERIWFSKNDGETWYLKQYEKDGYIYLISINENRSESNILLVSQGSLIDFFKMSEVPRSIWRLENCFIVAYAHKITCWSYSQDLLWEKPVEKTITHVDIAKPYIGVWSRENLCELYSTLDVFDLSGTFYKNIQGKCLGPEAAYLPQLVEKDQKICVEYLAYNPNNTPNDLLEGGFSLAYHRLFIDTGEDETVFTLPTLYRFEHIGTLFAELVLIGYHVYETLLYIRNEGQEETVAIRLKELCRVKGARGVEIKALSEKYVALWINFANYAKVFVMSHQGKVVWETKIENQRIKQIESHQNVLAVSSYEYEKETEGSVHLYTLNLT